MLVMVGAIGVHALAYRLIRRRARRCSRARFRAADARATRCASCCSERRCSASAGGSAAIARAQPGGAALARTRRRTCSCSRWHCGTFVTAQDRPTVDSRATRSKPRSRQRRSDRSAARRATASASSRRRARSALGQLAVARHDEDQLLVLAAVPDRAGLHARRVVDADLRARRSARSRRAARRPARARAEDLAHLGLAHVALVVERHDQVARIERVDQARAARRECARRELNALS